MRLWAKANSVEIAEIESVMVLGLTDGVLLIRYTSFAEGNIHGDHWYPSPDEAKRDAEEWFGVSPTDWPYRPKRAILAI
jgi:hypothetical protein